VDFVNGGGGTLKGLKVEVIVIFSACFGRFSFKIMLKINRERRKN